MELLYEEIKELDQSGFIQKIGRPQYRIGQNVFFYYEGEDGIQECYGKIQRINKYGIKKVPKEVSYDICGPDLTNQVEQTVYKDVSDSMIEAVI